MFCVIQLAKDFSFGLYELDWNVFNTHVDAMVKLVPKLAMTGIKTTVCGPESFTPDHKPLMGKSQSSKVSIGLKNHKSLDGSTLVIDVSNFSVKSIVSFSRCGFQRNFQKESN